MVSYHHQQDNMDSKLLASVIKDLRDREKRGKDKYNTTMDREDLNLRAWLSHQYEELLDAALYLKKAIREIDESFKLIDNQ